jgi:aryl-alcohol dehydrogenase-like predicted oxidoreductase
MDWRTIGGPNGIKVSAIGLGCMGMSDFYGPADRNLSIKTIHAALDADINFFNTGDFYGMGDNEMLLAEALADRRAQAVISVKFGALRGPDGSWLGFGMHPSQVKSALAYSLKRLRTDYIDLYQPCRVSREVPIEEVIGALKEMVTAGYVRQIGLSEASAQTVQRACQVHPVAALETEYSLFDRDIEESTLPILNEMGVAVVAYGVLSRGLIGARHDTKYAPGDYRNILPRFQGENLARNLKLVQEVRDMAQQKGISEGQLALAWVLAQGKDVVPLIGARTPERVKEATEALEVKLSPEELNGLDHLAQSVAGTRYPKEQMAMLNG